MLPLPFPASTISGRFGDARPNGRKHLGLDFAQPKGTPIKASGRGFVRRHGYSYLGGHNVVVAYDGGLDLIYYHGDSPYPIADGARVEEGTVLGPVGSTGGDSTGAHLHVEAYLYPSSTAVNPADHLGGRVVGHAAASGGAGEEYPARALYGEAWVRSAQEKLIRLGYDLGEWGADGEDGDRTQDATRDFQRKHGLKDDGIFGPETNGVADQVLATPAPPAFPLPEGSYFGPKSGGSESVSGYFSHREEFKVWQRRMIERGWDLGPDGADGLYGDYAGNVAEGFQREKGLTVDRLIGRDTWDAAWTSPVT